MLGDSWSSAPLLADLMLARMSRGDLYGHAWELSWRLRAGCLVVSLGFYPSCAPMQRAKLLAPQAAFAHSGTDSYTMDDTRRQGSAHCSAYQVSCAMHPGCLPDAHALGRRRHGPVASTS